MQETKSQSFKPYMKKGQAGVAVGSIITLIVGVGVAVLVLIFVGSLGGQTYNLVEPDIDAISGTVTNESFTVVTANTPIDLGQDAIDSSTVTVYNASSGAVPSTNYTINGGVGKITMTDSVWNGDTLNITYTHGTAAIETNVKNSILESFGALEQTGKYLPIIVLAVVISLVLSLVLSFTAFRGGGGSAL